MTNKELISDLEKNVYCRLQPSPVHGVGVFAIRDIPKGTDPFRGHRSVPWKKARCEELFSNPRIPEEVKRYIADVYPIEGETIYMPDHGLNAIDIFYFLNHSDAPNVGGPADTPVFVALRDIKKGEELFSDYRTYSDERGENRFS